MKDGINEGGLGLLSTGCLLKKGEIDLDLDLFLLGGEKDRLLDRLRRGETDRDLDLRLLGDGERDRAGGEMAGDLDLDLLLDLLAIASVSVEFCFARESRSLI